MGITNKLALASLAFAAIAPKTTFSAPSNPSISPIPLVQVTALYPNIEYGLRLAPQTRKAAFAEITGVASVNAVSRNEGESPSQLRFSLQCGLTQSSDKKSVVIDPNFIDLSLYSLEPQSFSYTRYQKIDQAEIVTVLDPDTPKSAYSKDTLVGKIFRVSVQFMNGQHLSKYCEIDDNNTDRVHSCKEAPDFLTPSQLKGFVGQATGYCEQLLATHRTKIPVKFLHPANRDSERERRRQNLLRPITGSP